MTSSIQPPALAIRGLGIHYQGARNSGWVLSGINFDVQHGETLAVIGRNGAGKSSLLRILADITLPDAGTVTRAPATRASLLSLNMSFIPHLPCYENIVLSCMLLGLRKAAAKAQVASILEFADLDVTPAQRVGTFSSGQRARLALGIALATAPEIVLIDELLGVGDGVFREKSMAAIASVIASDRSVVLVSHNLMTVAELADRVLWIDEGRQRMLDTPDVVLPAYRDALKMMV